MVHLLLDLGESLLDTLDLSLTAHVGHLLVEGVLLRQDTALQLLAFEVVLFHVSDKLSQLLREFLLVLRDLT